MFARHALMPFLVTNCVTVYGAVFPSAMGRLLCVREFWVLALLTQYLVLISSLESLLYLVSDLFMLNLASVWCVVSLLFLV